MDFTPFGPDTEARLLQYIVEKGIITHDHFVSLLTRHPESSRIQALINDGAIDRFTVEQIRKDLKNTALTNFGRYERLVLIGGGGMARVYKAYDPTLGRYVVLKFIRGEDPDLAERLLLEARAQARIEHEHVCKIYEAGKLDGKPYISMQYITGRPLWEIAKVLSLEVKIQLVKEVAEGVHAAHRVGVIHRDLKPANIMVERTDEGGWSAYVLDFGLAREIKAPRISATGAVVGTAFYMSPEQARGEVKSLDRRTDIYSLGVTLYEIISGRLPFPAESTVDALVKIIEEEPVHLRKVATSVPRDVETIVMKCLEKDPARRYDSAKALAEDLSRYLEGDPVLARRSSPLYRVYKKAQKHKVTAITLLAATLIAIVFGAAGLYATLTARRQARLAQEFGQQVQEVEAMLRFAYMSPLHDVRPQRKAVMQKIQRLENQMTEAGPVAFAAGHYAIGRGYLALHRWPEAYRHLDLAWQNGYREPGAAYALGQVLGQLYQQYLQDVDHEPDPQRKEKRRREIEMKYRNAALRYLQTSAGSPMEARSYVQGLIAFYSKQYDTALQNASEAIDEIPWLYEARILQGEIHRDVANESREAGDYAKAMREYQQSERAYRSATQIAASNPDAYGGLCGLWGDVMELQLYGSGGDPSPSYKSALADCDNSLRADPEQASIETTLSRIHRGMGQYEYDHGQDPVPALNRSIESANRSIQLQSDNSRAFDNLGVALWLRGKYEVQVGRDARKSFEQAIDSHQKAIQLNPSFPGTYNNIAIAYRNLGEYLMSHGQNPGGSFDAAVLALNKGLKITPRDHYLWNSLGSAYLMGAIYNSGHGMDADSLFRQSIASYSKATEINPNFSIALTNLAYSYSMLAKYELESGKQPENALDQAIQAAKKSAKTNDSYPFTFATLGEVYLRFAQSAQAEGHSPREFIRESLRYSDHALSMNRTSPETLIQQAQAHLLLFDAGPATNELEAARKIIEEALRLDAKNTDALRVAAEIAMKRSDFVVAEKMLQDAVAVNANEAETYRELADLCRLKVARASLRQDSWEVIERGLGFADHAMRINPSLAEARAVHGLLLLEKAQRANPEAKDSLLQSANTDLKEALRMNPLLPKRYRQ